MLTTPVESASRAPAEAGAAGADGEGHHLGARHVDPGQRRRDLVVTHGPEGAAEAARAARLATRTMTIRAPPIWIQASHSSAPRDPGAVGHRGGQPLVARRRCWATCRRSRARPARRASVIPARYGPFKPGGRQADDEPRCRRRRRGGQELEDEVGRGVVHERAPWCTRRRP